jgi:hypothetical protein
MHVVNSGWKFDGNYEKPTFSPSVLMTSGHYVSAHKPGDACWCTYNRDHPERPASFECARCHSFVKAGQIQFLNDSTHALAGKTIPLEAFSKE